MDQKKITEAYDSSVGQYIENCYNELDYKPLDRQLLDRFSELTKNKGKICDIGCGPGHTTKYLSSKGGEAIGIDISGNMIKEAKRLNPDIDFRVDNMFETKFPDAYFAGICSFYAIVNFNYKEITYAAREYFRLLNNNGLLLAAFHVGEKEIKVDDFFMSGKPLDFYYFDENRILQILKETGFKILEALVRFPYEREYPSKRAYIFAEK